MTDQNEEEKKIEEGQVAEGEATAGGETGEAVRETGAEGEKQAE